VTAGLVQGNALAPALTWPLFVDLPQIHNEGQPDLELRLDLVAALYGGGAFLPRDGRVRTRAGALGQLRSLLPDRPWLFVLHASDHELADALNGAGATERVRGVDASIHELRPLASMSREDR
jgi:hypothetical protein